MKKIEALKTQADRNTTALQGSKKNGFITVKEGTPVDRKSTITKGERKIGVCKGVTKNMENYESLRVDVWLEDTVQEGETVDQAFIRLGAIVDEKLQEQVDSILG